MWRTRARIGQIVTYFSIVPLAVGVASIVFAAGYDQFSNGMFWLLGGGVIAGLGSGWCIPLRAGDRADVVPRPRHGRNANGDRIPRHPDAEEQEQDEDDRIGRFWTWRLSTDSAPSIRTLGRDLLIVWIALILIVGACVLIGATTQQDFDHSIFSFVAALPFFPVLGAGAGAFVGMLLIGPIWDIPMQVADGRNGPNALKLSIALVPLFLLIFGFAIAGASAVHDDLGPSGTIGAGREIFTVLTGLPLFGVSVTEPGLAWVARVLGLLIVIAAAVAAHYGQLAVGDARRRLAGDDSHDPTDSNPGR